MLKMHAKAIEEGGYEAKVLKVEGIR